MCTSMVYICHNGSMSQRSWNVMVDIICFFVTVLTQNCVSNLISGCNWRVFDTLSNSKMVFTAAPGNIQAFKTNGDLELENHWWNWTDVKNSTSLSAVHKWKCKRSLLLNLSINWVPFKASVLKCVLMYKQNPCWITEVCKFGPNLLI